MLLEQKTTDFLEQLSSSAPIPGGGGASAAVGAFASALGLMVTNLTVGKKKYADVEEEILEIREKLEQKKQDLVRMVDEDAEAFEPLAKAYRMPKETEEEQAEKEKVMEAALKNAAEAPLCIMKTIVDTMEMIRVLGEKDGPHVVHHHSQDGEQLQKVRVQVGPKLWRLSLCLCVHVRYSSICVLHRTGPGGSRPRAAGEKQKRRAGQAYTAREARASPCNTDAGVQQQNRPLQERPECRIISMRCGRMAVV